MEFSGLFKPYPANRPLKDEERQRQLHQKQRLDVEEGDDLSVIQFNSSYMEVVDKWFIWRGVLTSVFIGFASIFLPMIFSIIPDLNATGDDLLGQLFVFFLGSIYVYRLFIFVCLVPSS